MSYESSESRTDSELTIQLDHLSCSALSEIGKRGLVEWLSKGHMQTYVNTLNSQFPKDSQEEPVSLPVLWMGNVFVETGKPVLFISASKLGNLLRAANPNSQKDYLRVQELGSDGLISNKVAASGETNIYTISFDDLKRLCPSKLSQFGGALILKKSFQVQLISFEMKAELEKFAYLLEINGFGQSTMCEPFLPERCANLEGVDLRDADLNGVNLCRANLRGADLRGVDFLDTNLRFADLSGADLSGANLRSADLEGASLRSASLKGADLSGVDLSNVVLANSVGLSDRESEMASAREILQRLEEGWTLDAEFWHGDAWTKENPGTVHCLAGMLLPDLEKPGRLASRMMPTLAKFFFNEEGEEGEMLEALKDVAAGTLSVWGVK